MRLARIAGAALLSIFLLSSISCATPTYHLSTSVNGQGSIMPSSGDFLQDRSVIILADAASGWQFDHWEGALSGNDSLVTITMNSDKAIVAYFVETDGTGNVTTSEFKTYTNNSVGFAMSVPASWDATSMGALGVGFGSSSLCSEGGVSAMVSPMNIYGSSLQSYYGVSKTGLESLQGYTFISEEEITIGGIPAMTITYIMVTQGVSFQIMQCFLVQGQRGWLIQFLCAPECWNTYEGTFDTMLNSFQVLD